MSNTTIDQITRPESGHATGASRSSAFDAPLVFMLQTAKGLGDKSGLPSDWIASWHRHWEGVGSILHRIERLLGDMDGFVERADSDNLERAMEAWKSMQAQDVEMNRALDGIRSQAGGLHAEARQEWKQVDAAITVRMEGIHARALALRVKLELMKDYTKSEVSHLLAGMLEKLPNRARSDTTDAEAFVQQYRQTVHELDEERHEFGGFMDFIKGLAMWVETPEERMKKKRFIEGGP